MHWKNLIGRASEGKIRWFQLFSSREEADEKVPYGKMVKVEMGGKFVCLAHTRKGFFAIDDECPHMSDSLSRGSINDQNQVICPSHRYAFQLLNGKEEHDRCRPVVRHEIRISEQGFFIGLKE